MQKILSILLEDNFTSKSTSWSQWG